MLMGLAILLASLVVAVAIARVLLGGMMRLAFQRVRMILRKLVPRRATARDGLAGRRREER